MYEGACSFWHYRRPAARSNQNKRLHRPVNKNVGKENLDNKLHERAAIGGPALKDCRTANPKSYKSKNAVCPLFKTNISWNGCLWAKLRLRQDLSKFDFAACHLYGRTTRSSEMSARHMICRPTLSCVKSAKRVLCSQTGGAIRFNLRY